MICLNNATKKRNKKRSNFLIENSIELDGTLYELIHSNAEKKSMIISAYKRPNENGSEDIWFQNAYFADEFQMDKYNSYFSMNTFHGTRQQKNLSKITSFYMDLDTYKSEYSKDAVLYFLHEYEFDITIPSPTAIIDSGYGLYLIWKLKDNLPKEYSLMFNKIQNYLYDKLKEYGADKKSMDISRVLRNTDTINTKDKNSPKVVSFITKNDYLLYEIDDFAEYFDLSEQIKNMNEYTQRKNSTRQYEPTIISFNKKNKIHSKSNQFEVLTDTEIKILENNLTTKQLKEKRFSPLTLALARSNDLLILVKARKYDVTGFRNSLIYTYAYFLFIVYDRVDYVNYKVNDLNNSFIEPLDSLEIDYIINSIKKVLQEDAN